MAKFNASLVISLVDQFSGRAKTIAQSIQQLYKAGQTRPVAAMRDEGRRLGAASRTFAGNVSTPLGLGMAALVQSTQEFEKALVGVQVAGIMDNMKDGQVAFGKLREDAEKTKQVALELSEALRLKPEGLLKAGEAAAKMGLPAQNLATLMKMAGSINIQDSSLSPEAAAEFLGSMGINFKAGDKSFERGTGKGDYDADATKIANQLLAIANMTRTSAGRLQEGMRQFGPLYAGFGMTFAESASLIGGMVQAGQLDTESGTALKSAGVRMLSPTAQGREALLKSGVDRSKYMDLSAVSGGKAFTDLMRLTDVRLNPKQRDALKAKLVQGEKNKSFLDEKWQQEFLRMYNGATGANTAEAREANLDRVMMSLTTGGGRIDMLGLFRELAAKMEKGELTDAQLSKIFEGRHLSKYKALFALMPKVVELLDKSQGLKDEVTNAGNELWRASSAGQWEGALASLQRAFIRLRESQGVTGFIESISRLGEALAKAPPGVVENLGKAVVALAIAGPVGLALSGVAAGVAVLASSARLATIAVGALTRVMIGGAVVSTAGAAATGAAAGYVALTRAATGARSAIAGLAVATMLAGPGGMAKIAAGAGLAAMAARASSLASIIGRLAVVGTTASVALGGIAAAGMFIYQNWQGIGEFFASFGTGFMAALGPVKPVAEGIASALGSVVDWLMTITGPIDETGAKWRSWGETAGGAIGGVVAKVADLVAWVGRLANTLTFGGAGKAGEWIAGKLGIGAAAPGAAAPAAPGDPADRIRPMPTGPLAAKPPAPGAAATAVGAAGAMPSTIAPGAVDTAGIQAAAQQTVVVVRGAMDQVRAIVQQTATDMTALGTQAMHNYAAGIRAGAPAVGAAVNDAMSAQVRGAVRGSYSDGGYR